MKFYFQTWTYLTRIWKIPFIGRWLYIAIQNLCGRITGHEISKTEWGYGGGKYGDVWCRWCNQIGRIPISNLDKRFENARSTIWGVTGCDIKQQEWKT